MAGKLSTHILDTARGRPAAGVAIALWRKKGEDWVHVVDAVTNADGRTDRPLLDEKTMVVGVYELRFALGPYFAAESPAALPYPFLDDVPVRFGIADANAGFHVPLLVTPWSYSTYRGS